MVRSTASITLRRSPRGTAVPRGDSGRPLGLVSVQASGQSIVWAAALAVALPAALAQAQVRGDATAVALNQPAGSAPAAAQVAVAPANAAAAAIVGEATLVIGSASVLGANGQSRSLERGGSVRVGDRIETPAGGHVHLRFVDGARLSIRPASRLLA
jgi:hypothetical protein